jgi:hypothetical protein
MNNHNPLQDVQPPLLTKAEATTQCGLQRPWEWEQPIVKITPVVAKPEPPKQNHFVRRGRQLFVLKKNIIQ